MTRERRQDMAFAALVASVALHVAIMLIVRPQIMTRIPGDGARERRLPPIRVSEPPPGNTVRGMDSVKDGKSAKPAPAPERIESAPSISSFSAPEAPPLAVDAPAVKEATGESVPEIETIPRLAEAKMKLSPAKHEDVSPAVLHEASAPVVRPAEDVPAAVAAEAADALAMAMFMPAMPVAKDVADEPLPPPVLPDVPAEEEREAFVPKSEVMERVDEKTVEMEKAAVRSLLDDRNASELSKSVSVKIEREDPSDGWIYFKVAISPLGELAIVPKDVVILMDASGSIGRDRLRSCREAVRSILRSCTNTGDRFNLVAFRDRFSYAFKSWRECDIDSFELSDRWLDRLAAHGRTDVFSTIRSVLSLPRDPKRPLVALVVTDGDANSGVSRTADILSRFTALNDGLVSVYMYGVRGSANRELIDMLTRGNRGESFIFDGDRGKAGESLESLGRRFRDPVLADMRVIFAGGEVEMYPRLLKNLYAGDSVTFSGRVPAGTGKVSFSVKGLNGANAFESFYSFDFAKIPAAFGIKSEWDEGRAIERKLGK